MEQPKRFYLVWSPQGGPPRHRHPTHRAAQTEAKRLAKTAPGQQFIVLVAIESFEVHDVRHDVFQQDEEDDIPF